MNFVFKKFQKQIFDVDKIISQGVANIGKTVHFSIYIKQIIYRNLFYIHTYRLTIRKETKYMSKNLMR